ncbi:MAG: ABC transporter ATP-binding protein [Oligoflexales bacterium]
MLTFKTFTKKFVLSQWRWYVIGLIFLAGTNLITLEIPQLAKKVVNELGKETPADNLRNLTLVIIGLGFTQLIARGLSRIFIFWPGRQLEVSSKAYFFSKVINLPQTFFDKFGMGDLISRLSNDMQHLRVFYAFAVLQIFNLGFLLVFTITKMALVNAKLTAMALLPIILMLAVTRVILPRLHEFSRQNLDAVGRMTNHVTESFVNVHVIQQSAAQESFVKRISQENDTVYDTNMKVILTRTLFFPLLSSLSNISQLIVLYMGGYLIIRNALSVGDILAFNLYLTNLAFPLMSLGIILSIQKRAKTALERLSVIEEGEEEHALPSAHAAPVSVNQPVLVVDNLSFSYGDERPAVLENVSFSLMEREVLGVFGRVGSGKSTLFMLLTRIYDPPANTIFFLGRDILSYTPAELREKIGLVLQQPQLFSTSIAENLRLGLDSFQFDDLERSSKLAQVSSEIESFEHKWETQIGERGIRLSGGQKQRLALARLLMREYNLWLFDDVMAAVDHQTERKLADVLLTKKRTTIIASHRMSVLTLCDKILVLENGKQTGYGKPDEVRKIYAELEEVAIAQS